MRLAENTTILDERLGPNFRLGEFTRSDYADRFGIDNTPRPAELECLRFQVRTIWQPARDYFRRWIQITSGFRCPELNALAGGVADSGHVLGCAGDGQVVGVAHVDLARWIAAHCDFDEVAVEYMRRGSRWVHVYTRPWERSPQKRELLTIEDLGGRKRTHAGLLTFEEAKAA